MKILSRVLTVVFSFVIIYAVYYCWISFPVATGYSSKVLCSAVFLSDRNISNVVEYDLDFTPMQLVKLDVDRDKKSVTASILGLAKRKSIFRQGCGCTIVNNVSEQQLVGQPCTQVPDIQLSDTVEFPAGNRVSTPFPPDIDSVRVMAAVNKVFADTLRDAINQTRALIILYNGCIIAERYGSGFTAETRLAGWSMTKSITGALVGILADEKKIDIKSPAPVARWNNPADRRREITIEQLLQQTSGLEFDEEYSRRSHATSMLFIEGNASDYAASQILEATPGSRFSYSSGNTNILSGIIRNMTGANYTKYPYEKLFRRLHMYSAVMEPDASGTFVGSSYCYATARDWARFGMLYADSGRFLGEQIVPREYVLASIQPSKAAPRGEYGYQWWVNAGEPGNENNRAYPGLPRDMFFADGYEGQNIFVIPSKNLVIVRLGLTRAKQWGEVELINEVLNSK